MSLSGLPKQNARPQTGGRAPAILLSFPCLPVAVYLSRLLAITEQMQDEHKHIDEIEIQRQRAKDRLLRHLGLAVTGHIHQFDLL